MIRYNIYLWTPPTLTPEQEIQVGREIARVGRDACLRQTPYLSKEEQQRIAATQNLSTPRKMVIGLIGVLLVGLMVFTGGIALAIALIAVTPLLVLSIGSLLHAKKRYQRWVDEMLAKYAAHVAGTEKSNT